MTIHNDRTASDSFTFDRRTAMAAMAAGAAAVVAPSAASAGDGPAICAWGQPNGHGMTMLAIFAPFLIADRTRAAMFLTQGDGKQLECFTLNGHDPTKSVESRVLNGRVESFRRMLVAYFDAESRVPIGFVIHDLGIRDEITIGGVPCKVHLYESAADFSGDPAAGVLAAAAQRDGCFGYWNRPESVMNFLLDEKFIFPGNRSALAYLKHVGANV